MAAEQAWEVPFPRQRASKFKLVALLLVIGTVFYQLNYHLYPGYVARKHTRDKEEWIHTLLDTSINGQYDGSAIQEKCANTKWQEGLIFSCDGLEGGVGIVRNIALNCVRLAMEAGAGLIIPKITARGKYDLTLLSSKKFIDFDAFFYREHLVRALNTDCPEMTLYDSMDALWDKPSIAVPHVLQEERLVAKLGAILTTAPIWRNLFDDWLRDELNSSLYKEPSQNFPIRISLHKPLFIFPTSYDSLEFKRNFGRIVQFHPAIRRVSAKVLFALSKHYGLEINPTKGIVPFKFMGTHLRTEADASKAGSQGFEFQSKHYLDQTARESLGLMYVASGDQNEVLRLAEIAMKQFEIKVVQKYDVLEGQDLKEMQALTWDQQGLVDFEVLLRSSNFAGSAESSFSWNVALRRQLESEITLKDALNCGEVVVGDRSDCSDKGKGVEPFVDGLSTLFGPTKRVGLYGSAMWP